MGVGRSGKGRKNNMRIDAREKERDEVAGKKGEQKEKRESMRGKGVGTIKRGEC